MDSMCMHKVYICSFYEKLFLKMFDAKLIKDRIPIVVISAIEVAIWTTMFAFNGSSSLPNHDCLSIISSDRVFLLCIVSRSNSATSFDHSCPSSSSVKYSSSRSRFVELR
jgi:hypothetical protein